MGQPARGSCVVNPDRFVKLGYVSHAPPPIIHHRQFSQVADRILYDQQASPRKPQPHPSPAQRNATQVSMSFPIPIPSPAYLPSTTARLSASPPLGRDRGCFLLVRGGGGWLGGVGKAGWYQSAWVGRSVGRSVEAAPCDAHASRRTGRSAREGDRPWSACNDEGERSNKKGGAGQGEGRKRDPFI